MGEVIYGKLVRDGVPAAIRRDGFTVVGYIVPEEDRPKVTVDKVVEEARELQTATTREERIAERADLEEILDAHDTLFGITKEEIALARQQKYVAKGAFKNFVYLESATSND